MDGFCIEADLTEISLLRAFIFLIVAQIDYCLEHPKIVVYALFWWENTFPTLDDAFFSSQRTTPLCDWQKKTSHYDLYLLLFIFPGDFISSTDALVSRFDFFIPLEVDSHRLTSLKRSKQL